MVLVRLAAEGVDPALRGALLFRKLGPFFYGLILGEFTAAGLWQVYYFV